MDGGVDEVGPRRRGDEPGGAGDAGNEGDAGGATASDVQVVALGPDLVARESARRAALRPAGVRHRGLARLVAVRPDPAGVALEYALPAGAQRLGEGSPADPFAAAATVCHAVAALHASGHTHGAVGPGQVWIGPDGAALLSGVGLAAAAGLAPARADDVRALAELCALVLPSGAGTGSLASALVRAADPDPAARPGAGDLALAVERGRPPDRPRRAERTARPAPPPEPDRQTRPDLDPGPDRATRADPDPADPTGRRDRVRPVPPVPRAVPATPATGSGAARAGSPEPEGDVVGQALADAAQRERLVDAGWQLPVADPRPAVAPRSPAARRRGVVGPEDPPAQGPPGRALGQRAPGLARGSVATADRRRSRRFLLPVAGVAVLLGVVVGVRLTSSPGTPSAEPASRSSSDEPAAAVDAPNAEAATPADAVPSTVVATPSDSATPTGDASARDHAPAVDATPGPPPTATGQDWLAVLVGLDRARAAAFEAADAALLGGADAPGSPAFTRDAATLAALRGRGLAVSGLSTRIRSVRALAVQADRAVLRVTDERSGYAVVDAVTGATIERRPPAGRRVWRVLLRRTADGWRTGRVDPR